MSVLQQVLHTVRIAASSTVHTAHWLFVERKLIGLLLIRLACEILGRFVDYGAAF